MAESLEQHLGGGLLHDASGVHHGDVVGASGHHPEIMGDQHHGHVALALLVGEQVEDLVLDGDIEGGGRLVGEQQLRRAGQRNGDADPLAHTTRQLVRVIVEPALGFGYANAPQQIDCPLPRVPPVDTEVVFDVLGELAADADDGVQ